MTDDSGFPTRMDRFAQAFTLVLGASVPIVVGVASGFEDGALPVLAVAAVTWPNLYLMYLLYRWRRRTDLRLERRGTEV